jgi:hypothetical protein
VYRFWRDNGYALGALIAGATADALGYGGAIAIIAGLTAASGIWVMFDMAAPQGHELQGLPHHDREPVPKPASATRTEDVRENTDFAGTF